MIRNPVATPSKSRVARMTFPSYDRSPQGFRAEAQRPSIDRRDIQIERRFFPAYGFSRCLRRVSPTEPEGALAMMGNRYNALNGRYSRFASTAFRRLYPEGRANRVPSLPPVFMHPGFPRCLDRISSVSLPFGRRVPCSPTDICRICNAFSLAPVLFPLPDPEGRNRRYVSGCLLRRCT